MNSNICFNCGAEYDPNANRRCSVCGAVMPKNLSSKEEQALSEAYGLLAESRFDEAKAAFEAILTENSENASAYWGRVRARYHISYVTISDGRSVPKSPTRSVTNLARDLDYRKALEFGDDEMKNYFKKHAQQLRATCHEVGSSKNITQKFTMGDVDPNDTFFTKKSKWGIPKKDKMKKIAIAVAAVLLLFLGVGYWTGFLSMQNSDGFEFRSNGDFTFRVSGVANNSAYELTLPSEFLGMKVTEIGEGAFKHNEYLEKVVIPEGMTSIGNSAFYGCTRLTDVTISDSITSIGNSAFQDCDSLVSIVIPEGVTEIGYSAFYSCDNLKDIVIPGTVKNIGYSAFQSCNALESIVIPEGVIGIGYSAFRDCRSLTSVVIPGTVTTIGDWAFEDCTSLVTFVIPDRVDSIGYSAFYGCSSLESIVIPESVTIIGYGAFRDCMSLSNILFGGTAEQWSSIVFGSAWDYNAGDYTVTYAEGD